jgi:hypothetical protein
MIVGCVATLRPLFRRIFSLGGNSVPERTPIDHHTTWPGVNARDDGRGHEWVVLHKLNNADRVKDKKPSTQLRHSESEEHILRTGIKITKTVLQNNTYVGKEEEERGDHSQELRKNGHTFLSNSC